MPDFRRIAINSPFLFVSGHKMTISDEELGAIDDAVTKNASRGANSITIGDRRVDFIDPTKLLEARRAIAEEQNGGIYSMVPTAKGYY